MVRNLGFMSALSFKYRERQIRRLREGDRYTLRAKHARYPLVLRAGASDLAVFQQIFMTREYACFDDLKNAGLIIDCGANAGFSTAYFASRFPQSEIIAIEPDPENFEMLRRNTAPYGDRVEIRQTAVWSHAARLTISEAPYRDGLHWTRQVRECAPEEPGGFDAIDLGGILEASGHERISILKMDIEGAEAVVLAQNTEPWIDRVDNLAIELHDDAGFGDSRGAFERAIEGGGWTVSRSGELTVCRR